MFFHFVYKNQNGVGRIKSHIIILLFQILQLKVRMAEEASRMVEQETIQLCVLGKALAEDTNFLDICRGFGVIFFES